MLRYVPDFILNRYDNNIFAGCDSGFVLFFDIRDFSRYTEMQTSHGKKGADNINRSLIRTFGHMISIIERRGGIITGFAGDSFVAVFIDVDVGLVMDAADTCRMFLDKNYNAEAVGEQVLNGKIAVGYGEIKWKIISHDVMNNYYFYGEAIRETCNLEKFNKLLLYTRQAAQKIGSEDFIDIEYGCIPKEKHLTDVAEDHNQLYPYRKESRAAFSQKHFLYIEAGNEFREAGCAFISLKDTEEGELENNLNRLHRVADNYGGYINKLDYSDKGLVAVVLFGVPLYSGKMLNRLVDFALDISIAIAYSRIGLSRGRCYVGYSGSDTRREYTALGFTPNLASRLMEYAQPGEILVDKFTQENLMTTYRFICKGELPVKGLKKSFNIYSCQGKKIKTGVFERSEFVGRSSELAEIKDAVVSACESRGNSLIYIHGDPGIGKSRLIDKAKEQLADSDQIWCCMSCDAVLNSAYAPLKRFLASWFEVNDQQFKTNKIVDFRSRWNTMLDCSHEMGRIESAIGDLLGVNWKNSVYSQLQGAARLQQQEDALVSFFLFIARQKTLIMVIDDAQWIDEHTKQFLHKLSNKINSINAIIICSSRFKNDGSQVDLHIDNIERKDIILNRLHVDSTLQLIKSNLKLSYIPQETEQLVIRKSQCTPLFIEQICWYLKEQNLIDKEGFLRANIEYVNTFGIVDIIGARLDNLTSDLRKLVSYASVLGSKFDTNILKAMMKINPDETLHLGENNRIFTRMSEFEYIFTHILLRDTAYARMLENKQKELHHLAAECYEKIYGTDNKDYFDIIGFHWQHSGEELKAATYYLKAGMEHRIAYHLADAEAFYDKAIEIHQRLIPEDKLQMADDLHLKSIINCIRMKHDDAIKDLLTVLNVYQSQLGLANEKTIQVFSDLGLAFRDKGDQINAMVYTEKELQRKIARYGDIHPEVAKVLNKIGLIYFLINDFKKAKEYFMMSLNNYQQCPEKKSQTPGPVYGSLAAIYHVENDLDKALEYNQKELQAALKVYPEHHYEIGRIHVNLGNVQEARNNHEDAVRCFLKAARIFINITGIYHPRVADIYNSLAGIYLKDEIYDKAKYFVQKAIEITDILYDHDHPMRASQLITSGEIYLKQNDLEKAFIAFQECQKIREEKLGLRNPYTAEIWNKISEYYVIIKQFDKAEELLTKAHKTFSELYGAGHPLAWDCLKSLAKVKLLQNDLQTAENLYKQVLDLQLEDSSTEPKYIAAVRLQLIKVYLAKKEPIKALIHYKHAREFYDSSSQYTTQQKELKKLYRKINRF